MILVTGACGNIGPDVVTTLLENGLSVVGFDVKNKTTEKKNHCLMQRAKAHHHSFIIHWQDFSHPDENELEELFSQYSFSGIVHLAYIIPPLSEINPEYAYKINVESIKNLIAAAEKYAQKAVFVFSSSTTVFGPAAREVLINEDYPVTPTSHYTQHKIECERLLQQSLLDWRILRFSMVLNPTFSPSRELLHFSFKIDLNTPVEPVHVKDVALAVLHALKRNEASRKIFIIAGGEKNRMFYKDIILKILSGIISNVKSSDIPWDKYKSKPYYLHWYDTTKSQQILTYQNRTVDDYISDVRKSMPWWKRFLIPLFKKYVLRFYCP